MNRQSRRKQAARDRKKRFVIVRIAHKKPGADVVIGPPNDDGSIQFFDRATGEPFYFDQVETEMVYGRKKGPKTIVRSKQNSRLVHTDQNQNLIQNFDHVFAVDTNTDSASDRRATVVIWLHNLRFDASVYHVEFKPQMAMLAKPSSDPEKSGWIYALKVLSNSPQITGRIALLVDAHLAELAELNLCKIPILNDIILPKNTQLLYASADVGKNEYIGAAAMHFCDRLAKEVLRTAPEQEMPFLMEIPEALFEVSKMNLTVYTSSPT